MKRRSGFTLVELLLATTLLVVALMGGVLVSRSALTVAGDSVRTGAAESRALHAQALVRQYLLAAGRSTLEATPTGGAPEVMQDGVTYDNVTFRETVANTRVGPTYDPDPGDPANSLAFQARAVAGGEGDLVLTTASGSHPICGGIRDIDFTRQGSTITVRIVAVARGSVPDSCTIVRSLVLRNL
jgi:prepilin-type N-terminal cleavage/methylation domain-containing protein